MRPEVPAPPVGAAAHEFGALGLAAGGDADYAHAYAPRPYPRRTLGRVCVGAGTYDV